MLRMAACRVPRRSYTPGDESPDVRTLNVIIHAGLAVRPDRLGAAETFAVGTVGLGVM